MKEDVTRLKEIIDDVVTQARKGGRVGKIIGRTSLLFVGKRVSIEKGLGKLTTVEATEVNVYRSEKISLLD